MNYVTPIPGRWYKLYNINENTLINGESWIVRHTKDKFNCPYLHGNIFDVCGDFNGQYRYVEVFGEEVNPYVPEEYKIKLTYEIY